MTQGGRSSCSGKRPMEMRLITEESSTGSPYKKGYFRYQLACTPVVQRDGADAELDGNRAGRSRPDSCMWRASKNGRLRLLSPKPRLFSQRKKFGGLLAQWHAWEHRRDWAVVDAAVQGASIRLAKSGLASAKGKGRSPHGERRGSARANVRFEIQFRCSCNEPHHQLELHSPASDDTELLPA